MEDSPLLRELPPFRRIPFVNNWQATLARISDLETLASAIMGLSSSFIDNINKNPDAPYDGFVDATQTRLAGLETLANAIMGISSSVIDNIDKSDLQS